MFTKNAYRKITTTLLLLTAIFALSAHRAAAATIAVVSVSDRTNYPSEWESLYNDVFKFQDGVGAILSNELSHARGLTVLKYGYIRPEIEKFFNNGRRAPGMAVSREQALKFATAKGIDYVVIANIREARVKSSESLLRGPAGKKFSLWSTVDITMCSAASGDCSLRRSYDGRYQFTAVGNGGLVSLSASSAALDGLEIGIPFVSIAKDFAADVPELLGLGDAGGNAVAARIE